MAMPPPARERINPYLDQDARHVVQQHLARYGLAASYVHARRVLDVACGTGYGSAILAACGAVQVTAMDRQRPSPPQIMRMDLAGDVRFLECDLDATALDPLPGGTYDVAVCFETLEHLQHPRRFLRRLAHQARQLLVSVPWNERPGANPYHLHHWQPRGLSGELAQNGWLPVYAWKQVGAHARLLPLTVDETLPSPCTGTVIFEARSRHLA
jgi:SAM-dependent methyltransferase